MTQERLRDAEIDAWFEAQHKLLATKPAQIQPLARPPLLCWAKLKRRALSYELWLWFILTCGAYGIIQNKPTWLGLGVYLALLFYGLYRGNDPSVPPAELPSIPSFIMARLSQLFTVFMIAFMAYILIYVPLSWF
jgi:hypothetical protein